MASEANTSDGKPRSNSDGGIARDRLKSFIERVEWLEDEKRAIAEDIKEVYAKAKGIGFDTKIMRQVVKRRRMDKDDLDEQEALLETYERALLGEMLE